jgi:serine/threonine protein kinase
MEHVEGVNLATLIETCPVPYPVAIFIVRELLSGLGYIHESWGRADAASPGWSTTI